MKLAVIFLCLSVANFIGTSEGGGDAKANDIGTVEVSAIVFSLGQVLKTCNCLKKCDKNEIPIRKKDACKAIMEHLGLICKVLKKTLVDALATMHCTGSQLKALLSGKIDDILEAFDGNIDPLLAFAVNLTQCLCAAAGVLLKTALGIALGILGLEDLLSDCPGLLDTIEEVLLTLVAITAFIGFLTLVTGITTILTGITGAAGGLLGLGGLFGGKSC